LLTAAAAYKHPQAVSIAAHHGRHHAATKITNASCINFAIGTPASTPTASDTHRCTTCASTIGPYARRFHSVVKTSADAPSTRITSGIRYDRTKCRGFSHRIGSAESRGTIAVGMRRIVSNSLPPYGSPSSMRRGPPSAWNLHRLRVSTRVSRNDRAAYTFEEGGVIHERAK
jgi:hypothetical protein